MKQIVKIENLHCAACAMELQEELEKIEGVNEVSVDFITQSIAVDVINQEVLRKVIKKAGRFEKVRVLNGEQIAPKKLSHMQELLPIFLATILLTVGILLENWFVKDVFGEILLYAVYIGAYLVVGYPVLLSTAKNIVKGKIFDENFLMTVASIGAFVLGECSEGVLVMLLYQLGEFLQRLAVNSSRRSIADLMDLKSEFATLIKDGEQIQVAPEALAVGDIFLVKAGEKISVDGVIVEGESALDVKSLTGEPLPKYVKTGDEVLSGAINQNGNLYIRVLRAYENSAVAKILDLVENASAKKAEPEKFISKFAKIYTPVVCLIALCIAVVPPIAIGLSGEGFAFADWIIRALSLLVISCPCALIISVPLTYFGGIGAAARYGILIKGATYLDKLTKVKIAAFDKTGTLTEGNFKIVNVSGHSQTLPIAAAAEHASSHPLAKPFESVLTPYIATDAVETAGKGISCKIDGQAVLVGSASFLEENCVNVPQIDSLSAVIYVAKDGEFLGYIEIDDAIKEEASAALAEIKALGISKRVVLTGDKALRAETIAQRLGGIDKTYAELLPDEKLLTLQKLQEEDNVLYVGDGINDAPVMAQADCAFSMGKLGSAVAIEASDFVLISDDLCAIPKAVKIAKKTNRLVVENIAFSILAKVILMVLALCGVLPLFVAVFGDVGVMLIAVLNAMRMRLPLEKNK
ncbi:MAG: cadmium-translocating P-type ATPase [Clostridia bacterium]|nr:cadmium-translocating P-type ATPase [Clostridia bacterium]